MVVFFLAVSVETGTGIPGVQFVLLLHFYMVVFFLAVLVETGTGIPAGMNSPLGDGDGRNSSLDNCDGDGDGESLSPRGRGWRAVPQRGIPRCHL